MTFRFGRGWVLREETDGEGTDAGGGAAAADGKEQGGAAGEAEPGAGEADGGGDAAGAGDAASKMMSTIDAALGYRKGPNGEELDPETGKPKEQPAKKEQPQETETHHANGKPKKDEKGNELDDQGKIVKPAGEQKAKTAAELDLTAQEKKQLHAKTQARFGEVINTLKQHEGTIAQQAEQIKGLSEARDAIMGVFDEVGMTQDHLAGYVEFHQLLQSEDPEQLKQALELVEMQRAAIYQALGIEPEGGGLDLLKDFPDLQKQVEEEEITRQAALEIAHGRRERAARERQQSDERTRQDSQRQTQQQTQKAAQDALSSIEKWTAELAKSDLDYKAKEDKLLAKVDGVIAKYPPHLWLDTLKGLYEGIEIQKAPSTESSHQRPLRPAGARPGTKAPTDMLEAINQGLGYAGAEKG